MRYFYIVLYSPIYYPCTHLHYLHTKTSIYLLGVYLIHSSYSRLGLCTYILPITICTYIYIYIYLCALRSVYIYIYVCVCIHTYIHTHTHTYIHTYIHTFTCKAAETIGSKKNNFCLKNFNKLGLSSWIWPVLRMVLRGLTQESSPGGGHAWACAIVVALCLLPAGVSIPRMDVVNLVSIFLVKSLPHFIWKGFSYYCSGNSCFYLFSGGNI